LSILLIYEFDSVDFAFCFASTINNDNHTMGQGRSKVSNARAVDSEGLSKPLGTQNGVAK
jgi:hypothetical protein